MNHRAQIRTAVVLVALFCVGKSSIGQPASQPSLAASSALMPALSPASSATPQYSSGASTSDIGEKGAVHTLGKSSPSGTSAGEEQKKESGSYDNVISALLGALLTFVATQYNEKKNWERKKSEQLRDKQFGKLSDAARALDSSSVVLSNAYSKLESLMRREGTSGGSSGVVEAELQALGRQASKDVSESMRVVKLAVIDLQICRALGTPIDTCLSAQKELLKARGYFESLAVGATRQEYTIVATASQELVRLSETFAASALDSLAG